MTSPAEHPELPHDRVAYPDPPWRMVGSLWLTLFRLGADVGDRPRGLYGAAFVSYDEGSPLTYSELLVARALPAARGPGPAGLDHHIWVDSPASVAGGRELWAIPKGLCDFDLDSAHRGPLTTTDWSASLGRRPIASATFRDVSRVAPRLPFRMGLWQPGLPEGGGDRSTTFGGSAKILPARARWDFADDGPLAFLRRARPLSSSRMASFRMTFG
ncbi:hypothetical protein FE634_08170 [Nocardioides dongxiaopingii]|uniref:acetoacetate decarboxylase family protein n=1 Tax=Nocardioides sp. S-1144 TaxID=2582905 RepID=UPI0011627A63|nr:acetoacetate decarboxylase family protein [Nocardioides sp. S-1144]QCW50387.2 hypothetical protein FE634_08170 [Nocardioides sp. S-1144]